MDTNLGGKPNGGFLFCNDCLLVQWLFVLGCLGYPVISDFLFIIKNYLRYFFLCQTEGNYGLMDMNYCLAFGYHGLAVVDYCLADVDYGLADADYGLANVGYGLADVGYGLADVEYCLADAKDVMIYASYCSDYEQDGRKYG
jgi:hypothetical protein